MITLGELAASLARAAATCHARLELTLEEEMVAVAELIRRDVIGHERPEFPPLAARTIAEKTVRGYVGHVSPTDPLLRESFFRDSIEGGATGLVGVVGSDDPHAAEHELGSATEPPRPAIALGAVEALPAIELAFGELAVELLTPGGGRGFGPGGAPRFLGP